jgi:hypothetical protein
MSEQLYMVIDCESIGLHGETFAVGWVVIDHSGQELEHATLASDFRWSKGAHYGSREVGDVDDFDWVKQHVPAEVRESREFSSARQVRDIFWARWQHWRSRGALLAADVAWPVEARFLSDCVRDVNHARDFAGPYPLLDIASVRFAAGLDPVATVPRLPGEEPAHDPQADARQSARLLIEALQRIRGWVSVEPKAYPPLAIAP